MEKVKYYAQGVAWSAVHPDLPSGEQDEGWAGAIATDSLVP